jgi:lipopolysaccharide export system ATP-binding protein
MKHRLPKAKLPKLNFDRSAEIGQSGLLADEPGGPDALVPSSASNAIETTVAATPAVAAAATPPPATTAAPVTAPEAEDDDSSYSFLSGPETPKPDATKAPAPAKNKVATKVILNQQPFAAAKPQEKEKSEKPVESPATDKTKTTRVTPPVLPLQEPVKKTLATPLLLPPKTEAKAPGWWTWFLASRWQMIRSALFPRPKPIQVPLEAKPAPDPAPAKPAPETAPAKPTETWVEVAVPAPETKVAAAPAVTPAPTPVAAVATGPSLIQTRGLVKQYGGRRVVNGVDIYVKPGEVVGLLGKNGAGKTTTFYMIVGLVNPTEGHVYMGDEDVTHMPMYRRARRGIGYLPQEESIFRKLTVEENLLAILETLHLTEEERDNRCDELLKDFGLEHVRENVAITLSGGEKRRVTIARALVTTPRLLLLDEPFSGVDPMAVHDIQEIILQLKNRGLGVLITDHNVRETLSVVDRAYIIDEGRVLSEGTREFLINDPIAREIYLGHRFSM